MNAHQLRHTGVTRATQNPLGWAALQCGACVNNHYAVGQTAGFGQVMGHQHDGQLQAGM